MNKSLLRGGKELHEIYSSIEGRSRHLMGKVQCTLFYYIWYRLDIHSYDMSKMQMTGGKTTWLEYLMTSPTSIVVWLVLGNLPQLWGEVEAFLTVYPQKPGIVGGQWWTHSRRCVMIIASCLLGKLRRYSRCFHHVGFISGYIGIADATGYRSKGRIGCEGK